MEKLSQLLHELADRAPAQGNDRAALHKLVDEALAELTQLLQAAAELGSAAAQVPPAPPAARRVPPFRTPPPKPDGAPAA